MMGDMNGRPGENQLWPIRSRLWPGFSRYPLPAGGPCGCGRKQRDLRFLPRWSIGTWLLAAVVSAANRIKAHRAGEK